MKKITYYHVYNGSIFGDKNDPFTRDFLFTDENNKKIIIAVLKKHKDGLPKIFATEESSVHFGDDIAGICLMPQSAELFAYRLAFFTSYQYFHINNPPYSV